MYIVYRFFVVIFAYALASLAAAAVMVFGASAYGLPAQEDWPLVSVFIIVISAVVMAAAFVPATIMVLIAEAFTLRSVIVYAAAGGVIGLACGYTLGFIEAAPAFRFETPMSTNFELLAAAGIAAGLVYWLIAGRSAGLWREHAEPAPR